MLRLRFTRASVENFESPFSLLLAVLTLTVLTSGPALAIPSPELVIGSFISLSQLFALGSALLGGGAVYTHLRGRRAGTGRPSHRVFIAAITLFAMCAAAIGFNVYQYLDYRSARAAHLESTLTRPAQTRGNLGEAWTRDLTFAQQNRHPLRISTEEAAKLLDARNSAAGNNVVLLDVREPAEQAIASLPGATPIRPADLMTAKRDLADKNVVVFCHNGNRSSEAAETLAKAGISARFIVGGLEKWVIEGRAVTGMRDPAALRTVADYERRNTLLDTSEVKELLAKGRLIFLDVRTPAAFSESHLPGAINLHLTGLGSDALAERIRALPKAPIVLPCYDRVSCFYAQALGYDLSRAGHDVRGRYTLPWEYFTARPRPPYVESYFVEQSRGLWSKATEALAALLSFVTQWTGVVLAIILLATISRLLVLPFSLKAERDQLVSRKVAGEVDDIKQRFKTDAARRTRALRAFYKRHGLTPMRNLLALAFLPVMAVALASVQEFAVAVNKSWLWIPHLSLRDPIYILPVAFGALITIYVDLAFVTRAKHRLALWITLFPAMIATGLMFSAAANIYLVASATMLLIQRLIVDGTFTAIVRWLRRSRLPQGVIPLAEVGALADKGNKAYRLAQMRAAGLPVPDGVVLSAAFLDRFAVASPEVRRRQADQIWSHLGRQRLAVRSSAGGEDGANKSFAGVFESVIDVERSALEDAIRAVYASFAAARSGSYLGDAGDGNVLVQQMVHADYAGVLFTRDPSAGALSMVELVKGTAEELVSGKVQPQSCRFGRISKRPVGQSASPIDLAPLLQLGDEAERLFGGPQDVEWAYLNGRFYLVQSRDITRTISGEGENSAVQDDLARVADLVRAAGSNTDVFAKNEMSEMLPRPTPLSLSLMEALWQRDGSVDLAARELGLTCGTDDGAALLTTIFGRLYVNKLEEKARSLSIGAFAARRLVKNATRIERDIREHFLPDLLQDIRASSVAQFDDLPTDELIAEIVRLHDRFVYDTHVSVDVVNISASIYLDRARRGLESAGVNASAVLGHMPETIESRLIAEISEAPPNSRRTLLQKHFGHRATLDYELAEPRYSENLTALNRMVEARESIEQARRPADYQEPAMTKPLSRLVEIARQFQTLKEDTKYHSLRELAILRRALLALDRKLGLDGDIFNLTFAEIRTMDASCLATLREKAQWRRQRSLTFRKLPALAATLTVHDLEAASAGDAAEMHDSSEVRGTRVSGSRIVEGRAIVISESDLEFGNPMIDFCDGDIVVAPMVDPTWLPYFSRAGGFVAEVGGWLSHPAILAREYDVAMVVGTRGIGGIANGSTVRINLDGKIEVIDKDNAAAAA